MVGLFTLTEDGSTYSPLRVAANFIKANQYSVVPQNINSISQLHAYRTAFKILLVYSLLTMVFCGQKTSNYLKNLLSQQCTTNEPRMHSVT